MALAKSQARGTGQTKKSKQKQNQTQATEDNENNKAITRTWEMSALDALKVNFVDSEL